MIKFNHFLTNMRPGVSCQRLTLLLLAVGLMMAAGGCLTHNAKDIIPPPWNPDVAQAAAQKIEPPVNEVFPVYFRSTAPRIDGQFDEWRGLAGATTRIAVFGGSHVPEDAEGFFAMITTGDTLYVYGRIQDDVVNENSLAGALAWRSDSVEVFIGTDTSGHSEFRVSDNHIRIVPRNRENPFDFELSINDVTRSAQTRAAVVIGETGYELEAEIPLALLRIDGLRPGQPVRVEFQVNDGDRTERDRLIHWMSERDDPWYDASVWGNGRVVEE